MAYSTEKKSSCLFTYRDLGRNMSATARQEGVSKPTLYNWKKNGIPDEVTGGVEWDEWLDRQEERELQRRRAEEIETERSFLEDQRERTDEILNKIHAKILAGEVEVRPSDWDKMIRLRLMLDNKERDKLEFMNHMASVMVELVMECFDPSEQEFALFRSKLLNLQSREKQKLELPANQG